MSTHTENQKNVRAVAALAVILTASCGLSQSNSTFSYQGRLSNGTNGVSGNFDLAVSPFGTNAGGVALASVTNQAVSVSGGLFTIPLDFGAEAFPGAARWLEERGKGVNP